MYPAERVLTALRGGQPDQAPFCELAIDRSLASYLRPENVLAMAAAVQKYGRYPLNFGQMADNQKGRR